MNVDMTAGEGQQFATRLLETADRIEQHYVGRKDGASGAFGGQTIDV